MACVLARPLLLLFRSRVGSPWRSPLPVRRLLMRIALVAGTDVGDAEERRALAAALRDAGHQVTEHVMDAGRDVRAAVPGFAAGLRSLWSQERPDAVHAFGWAGGLAALAAARDGGLPV